VRLLYQDVIRGAFEVSLSDRFILPVHASNVSDEGGKPHGQVNFA
jgi:hypothetical protein